MLLKRGHLFISLALAFLPIVLLLIFVPSHLLPKTEFMLAVTGSIWRLFVAYLISVVLAFILGILASETRFGNGFFIPLFDLLQSFPSFAILPFLARVLGASESAVIFFLIITMMWPILFAVISSLKLMKTEYREVVSVFKINRWMYMRKVLFPLALPGLVTGSVVGLGEGWEAVVGAELVLGFAGKGLGAYFQTENGYILLFGVIALLLVIFCINKLIWLPLLEKTHRMMQE